MENFRGQTFVNENISAYESFLRVKVYRVERSFRRVKFSNSKLFRVKVFPELQVAKKFGVEKFIQRTFFRPSNFYERKSLSSNKFIPNFRVKVFVRKNSSKLKSFENVESLGAEKFSSSEITGLTNCSEAKTSLNEEFPRTKTLSS